MIELYRIDDSEMPVVLGSALKVPSYAYGNWGIPADRFRDLSDDLYEQEWHGGSPNQMAVVVESIKRTGLGNYSDKLRDAAAIAVRYIAAERKGRINILEPGAGVSTHRIVEALFDAGEDLDRFTITMLEPGQARLDDSVETIKEDYGLRVGTHLHPHYAKDTDAPRFAKRGSQDIVVCVAQIHHHAYLDTPLRMLYYVTSPGGHIVTADWHNSMWEHPASVYQFISGMDWETKERDLEAFREMFPNATMDTCPEETPELAAANEDIRKFWRDGWAKVRAEAISEGRFDPRDDILMLEGHRPTRRYAEEMNAAGYVGAGGCDIIQPELLIPENEILALMVAQKPEGS